MKICKILQILLNGPGGNDGVIEDNEMLRHTNEADTSVGGVHQIAVADCHTGHKAALIAAECVVKHWRGRRGRVTTHDWRPNRCVGWSDVIRLRCAGEIKAAEDSCQAVCHIVPIDNTGEGALAAREAQQEC